MNALNKLFFLFALFLASTAAFAQGGSKEDLTIRKVRLQDEIQIANKILEEARTNRQASLTTLQTLNQKLRIREDLLRTIDREIVLIDREIEKQEEQIEDLKVEIDTLKAKYAGMIRQAYKNRSESSRLMFILAAEDFAQAVRRMEYLRQYSEYRRQQVDQIIARQDELAHQIEMLAQQREEKETLRAQRASEREELLQEQQEQKQTIVSLQEREGSLEEQIAAKQSEAQRLETEIQRLIAEEIRKERERAERKRLEETALQLGLVKGTDFNNRTTNARLTTLISEAREKAAASNTPAPEPTPAPSYALTPEAARLSRNFEANKGSLPWPVERGIIVGRFGRQPHPANNSIIVNNPHIEIATERGTEARCAFEGVVLDVIRIPGSPIAVIVQHGNFYTHYGNLSEAFVKKGDAVTAKQSLGKIYTDPSDNQTILQFGLWKDENLVDPSPWLAR